MKKFLLLIAVLCLMSFAICACEKKEEKVDESEVVKYEVTDDESETEEFTEEYTEEEEYVIPIADESVYAKYRINYNGTEFGVLDKYDDVKAGLGNEIKPSQTYTPCGAMVEGEVTTHFYEGLTLETNSEGIIYTIKFSSSENPDSTAALVTGIKLGSSHDEVINAYGASDSDDEYNTSYSYDRLYTGFSYDFEGDGTVNYFSIETAV